MTLFLQNKVDAAAAMTYNELAQVLETKNPETGKLYTLSDLNVITMERAGTAMLEDGVFAQGAWLKDAKNQDIAKRFLAASFKGWAYCRDHHAACVNIVLKNGTDCSGKGHQTWQMNEINKLIWPAPLRGIGVMNPVAFARTAAIAKQFKVIAKPPSGGVSHRPRQGGERDAAQAGRQHDRPDAGRPPSSRSRRAASRPDVERPSAPGRAAGPGPSSEREEAPCPC